ncbi:MAG: penicillin acylase family protein, partial [Rhodanobacter sp.]
MTTRRWRLLRAILLALPALVLVALAAGWWLLAGSLARLDGTRAVAALHSPVTIARDARGTATFDGGNRADITWAMGYVHAQERFFQMDLMRRSSAGELAALVGSAALPVDLNHRRHRLRAVADAAWAQLPPAQQEVLRRYAAGVNAGLADLRVRPWEYLLLGSRPEAWRPQDSLLVIAAMYLDLNSDGRNERELRIAQMRDALPASLVDFLLAPDPDWEAPLRGRLSRSPVVPGAQVFDLRQAPA